MLFNFCLCFERTRFIVYLYNEFVLYVVDFVPSRCHEVGKAVIPFLIQILRAFFYWRSPVNIAAID